MPTGLLEQPDRRIDISPIDIHVGQEINRDGFVAGVATR
jgi:hypothetical protein